MNGLSGLSLVIEQYATERNSYIAAIVDFAEEKEIDVEDVVEVLHPQIIEKLKIEFVQKNFFKDKKIDNSLVSFFGDN